jgi:hypothetical protein
MLEKPVENGSKIGAQRTRAFMCVGKDGAKLMMEGPFDAGENGPRSKSESREVGEGEVEAGEITTRTCLSVSP